MYARDQVSEPEMLYGYDASVLGRLVAHAQACTRSNAIALYKPTGHRQIKWRGSGLD